MKLKIILSIVFPPTLLVVGVMAWILISVLLGLTTEGSDFVSELFISLSILLIAEIFLSIVLLPPFYYIVWTVGDVNRAKVRVWGEATILAMVLSITGVCIEYQLTVEPLNIGISSNYYKLGFLLICILSAIISILFAKKRLMVRL